MAREVIQLEVECDSIVELLYRECLKCKFRKGCSFLGQEFIEKYEHYAVEKYHERNFKGYE